MKKLGDITQFFQPIAAPCKNNIDFYLYRFKMQYSPARKGFAVLKLAIGILSLIFSILDLPSARPIARFVLIADLVYSVEEWFITYVRSYNGQFTSMNTVPDVYDKILPPEEGWKKLILQGNDSCLSRYSAAMP